MFLSFYQSLFLDIHCRNALALHDRLFRWPTPLAEVSQTVRPVLPMRTPVTQAGWRIAIIARGGKMYSYSEIVSILLMEFPEINEQYAKEIAWLKDTFQNQESEGQTSYFDHCFCDYIGHLFVDKQQDNLKIEKIFVFLENMATSRDSDVRNLLQVTVLEYLRSWSLFQSKSEKFMLPETKKMFDYVKSYLQPPSQAVPEYILQ